MKANRGARPPRLASRVRAAALLCSLLAGRAVSLASAQGVVPQSVAPLEIPPRVRLLVVAPHPDDEILGAGGLMQRVRVRSGRVSVTYLTNGDGYRDGVELTTNKSSLRAQDFVNYGERRLHEALRALHTIRLTPKHILFFGFPDGGLEEVLTTHWSSKNYFHSPFTGDARPPYPESFDRQVLYSGVGLERELALTITRTNPDWISVTAPWDIHPDHCSAFHFVVRALKRLADQNRRFEDVAILAFTVHRPDWPDEPDGAPLRPPPNVDAAGAPWKSLALTSDELDGKGRALDQYTSQIDIMPQLFRDFVRPNEIFAVYSKAPSEPAAGCAVLAAER